MWGGNRIPRLISKVLKGWHYDFQDGENVFNFQGPRGVTTVYGNLCPNKGVSKIYVLGDRVFLGVNV